MMLEDSLRAEMLVFAYKKWTIKCINISEIWQEEWNKNDCTSCSCIKKTGNKRSSHLLTADSPFHFAHAASDSYQEKRSSGPSFLRNSHPSCTGSDLQEHKIVNSCEFRSVFKKTFDSKSSCIILTLICFRSSCSRIVRHRGTEVRILFTPDVSARSCFL